MLSMHKHTDIKRPSLMKVDCVGAKMLHLNAPQRPNRQLAQTSCSCTKGQKPLAEELGRATSCWTVGLFVSSWKYSTFPPLLFLTRSLTNGAGTEEAAERWSGRVVTFRSLNVHVITHVVSKVCLKKY